MKYLYIDKKQRVKITGKLPKRAIRILEELEKAGIEHDFAYNDSIDLLFKGDKLEIKINGKCITEYTHIIFGGHSNDTPVDYEIKSIFVDFIEKHNSANPDNQIQLQNSKFIKKLPYYTKIGMAKICIDHDLPHPATYYRRDGEYAENDLPFDYPTITKHYTGANRLQKIDGVDKIKKNVFKVDSPEEWKQEFLNEQELNMFFAQEFSETAADYRIFVSKGKVVGGWKRQANEGFMTVTGRTSTYTYYNEPSQDIVDICEKAAKAWEVDFMALDFIYVNEKPCILEFSMHPGFNAYETKCENGEPINVAKAIIESF